MSPKQITLLLLFSCLVISGLCKPLLEEHEYLVKDLEDNSEEYVKYVIYGEEEKVNNRRKPKNCVGVVTLMALCF